MAKQGEFTTGVSDSFMDALKQVKEYVEPINEVVHVHGVGAMGPQEAKKLAGEHLKKALEHHQNGTHNAAAYHTAKAHELHQALAAHHASQEAHAEHTQIPAKSVSIEMTPKTMPKISPAAAKALMSRMTVEGEEPHEGHMKNKFKRALRRQQKNKDKRDE